MPRVIYTTDERVAMAEQHFKGFSYRHIIGNFAGVYLDRPIPSVSTVQRIVKKFKETGNVDPAKGKQTSYPTRRLSEGNVTNMVISSLSETKMNIFLAVVEAHGKVPLSRVGEMLGVAKSTVYKTLREQHYRAYKIEEHQEFRFNDQESRMIFCERMMDKLNQDPGLIDRICFSDESTIELVGAPNRQNNRVWAQQPPEEVFETGTQYRLKLNVWVGMIRNTIMGPYFIEGNLNGEKYLRLLEEQILPALRAIQGDGPELWFQQDGAPPHFTLNVRLCLNNAFPDRWIGRGGPVQWPPRSPDLTPLDFSLWAYLKDKVYAAGPMADLEVLRDRITDVLTNLSPIKISNMINAFYDRLGYCSAAESGHFEQLLRRRVPPA